MKEIADDNKEYNNINFCQPFYWDIQVSNVMKCKIDEFLQWHAQISRLQTAETASAPKKYELLQGIQV